MKIEKIYSKRLKREVWYLDFTLNKERYRLSGFSSRKETLEAYAALLSRNRAERCGMIVPQLPWTLGHLLDKAEADSKWKDRPDFLRALRAFVEVTGRSVELTKLRQAHLRHWLESDANQDLKTNSRYTYGRRIIAVLNSASRYFPEFEWSPPKLPEIKLDPGRDRVLTLDEIGRLIAVLQSERARYESYRGVSARRHSADLFRLALLIPGRESELLALRSTDVNLDWMTVSIHSPKVNTKRVIPLTNSALSILQARWPEKGKAFFGGFNTQQLRRALMKASSIAEIPWGDQVENGWVFHDLRHTAATTMAAGNVDYSTLAHMLGHARRDMTARYIHPRLDAQRAAAEVLERFYLTAIGESLIESRPNLVSSF